MDRTVASTNFNILPKCTPPRRKALRQPTGNDLPVGRISNPSRVDGRIGNPSYVRGQGSKMIHAGLFVHVDALGVDGIHCERRSMAH